HRCRGRCHQRCARRHGRGGDARARDQESRSPPEEGDLVDAVIVELLLLELLLVALLAVLSASEAAIHTIRRPQLIEELAARGRRGRRAGTMGRKAVEYLASIQVAEFLIVFAFSGISAAYIAPRLSDLLRFVFGPGAPVVRDVAAVAVTVTALCLVAVLFGIFIPRTIGGRHAQTVLLILVWPLKLITTIGHSRIPVYEGSPDNIIGILYVKDLFRRLARGEKDVQIRPYLRAAQFVPETKKIDELLRDMQKDKVHIAIVVDEYGGTSGLVTIEDLVEEIVGEIRDEYDVEEERVLPVSESG